MYLGEMQRQALTMLKWENFIAETLSAQVALLIT